MHEIPYPVRHREPRRSRNARPSAEGCELMKASAYNKQTAGPQTGKVKAAAEDSGIPVVAVTENLPQGEDHISWMSAQIHALKSALDR
ncbi:hypothetical protein ACFTZK_17795 [Streptomyces decoyicus]|uniref:hypothetical protein n=1 Tax=Streptomyces decoyicus TaxID=249567 RepID=UPI003643234A